MLNWIKTLFTPKPNTQCFETIIGQNTGVVGSIKTQGCLHIHGSAIGGMLLVGKKENDTDSTLLIAQTSKVEFNEISAPHIIIDGNVTAEKIIASLDIVIKKTANVVASSITAKNISIEQGAIINCGSICNTCEDQSPVTTD